MNQITKEIQLILLNTAKSAIAFYLEHKAKPSRFDLSLAQEIDKFEILNKPFAAFVTLKINNELRGCIGSTISNKALIDQIIEQAINAGFADSRFQPVSIVEFQKLTFEISILSEPKAISNYQDINIEHDGIIISKYNRSALFLPKVPKEQGWDLITTLIYLCRKAGLDDYDWQEDTYFETFRAIEISS
ncbi:MAG: AmmeMemoRadiSam system protein A [Rickettsiales bacterium]|mgnify:CR=1 FL=1|nr:AmmeMemoRadiSam system protein A [Rickettsiales bacterium]